MIAKIVTCWNNPAIEYLPFMETPIQDGAPKIAFSCLKKVVEFNGLW